MFFLIFYSIGGSIRVKTQVLNDLKATNNELQTAVEQIERDVAAMKAVVAPNNVEGELKQEIDKYEYEHS